MFEKIKSYFRSQNPDFKTLGEALADAPSSGSAGPIVTVQSALGNPAIWKGCNLIAGYIGKTPFPVYKRAKDGSRDKQRNHPAHNIINVRPNQWTTPSVWKSTMIFHALMYGNGYSLIERQGSEPTGVYILDPERTAAVLETDELGTKLIYVNFDANNEPHRYASDDIIHIKGLSPDGLSGYTITDILSGAISHGLALQQFTCKFFKNGARPSIVIQVSQAMAKNKELMEQLKRDWRSRYTGDNAFKSSITTEDTKVIPVSIDNDSAGLVSSREFDLLMVANILCIQPHKLGSNLSSSYSSIESENSAFLSDCLDPWIVKMQEELSKLLTEAERYGDKFYIEAETKDLVRIDAATQSKMAIDQGNNRQLSWEELRQMNNKSTDFTKGHFFGPTSTKLETFEEPTPPPPIQAPGKPQDQAQAPIKEDNGPIQGN